MAKSIFFVCLLSITAQAWGDSDDKFFKKYAMMKIYESCFGPEVVKQIRQEMKDAYIKCSTPPSVGEALNDRIPSFILSNLGFNTEASTESAAKPTDGVALKNDLPQGLFPHKQLLANNPFKQAPFQQPMPYPTQNQFRPFPQPYYQFPFNPMFYPPGGVQYNPYAYQQPQFQQGYYQPYYAQNNRMSRNVRDRLDLELLSAMTGQVKRVRNVTCVVQELGYIDHNLEPNYEAITKRINSLPVPSELKADIQEGVQFCHKFSQCVPEVERTAPLSQELIKPMFFFRCYKHKKLEACIMKDIRERFASEDELDTDTDFRSLSRAARSIRDEPLSDPRIEALDEMSVYLYDYLSGGTGFDYDLYL
ncbi:unnamed protein product, partial [Brenthis ino]